MRALSERQYSRSSRTDVNEAITEALTEWRSILEDVSARSLDVDAPAFIDSVIHTDGSWPDHRKGETEGARIGAVVFSRDFKVPLACGCEIPAAVVNTWSDRASQIVVVELIATVVAIHTFEPVIRDKKIVWLIDSESVLGGLIKGNSDREDLGPLVNLFWKAVRDASISVYLDRIPTDGNLSDKPSRSVWSIAAQAGWAVIPAVVPDSVRVGRPV